MSACVVITGSRYRGASPTLRRAVQARIHARLSQLPEDVLIVVGGASGVDTWAEDYVEKHGRPYKVVRPDWTKHGFQAGKVRNGWMLDHDPYLVLAWWDGTSTGTKDCMDKAERRGIPVEVDKVA